MNNLGHLRELYNRDSLLEESAAADPFEQFGAWFEATLAEGFSREPNAMALATAGAGGAPSLRMVLLKGFDEQGFVFYTNYESRKGRELAENPRAALLFYWDQLERQVRIEGKVEKVTRAESAEYFQSRPRGSRLGAWASRQSSPVSGGRAALEAALAAREAEFGEDVPLPDFWGGYRLIPDVFEFWQGRPNRLHDRLRYRRGEETAKIWIMERLAP